mmetsp:Transcript_52018/g.77082  ORF Transcript_52018/g.77082 Transcript_52018/m.77082 type:complete len:448 (+) Transcript_52018:142-1485(+)|eukprot:CAMPEP_0195517678 /NCGR_PEP_ID=MMETSP0794_2-20130614/11254_1 /TAXON_ID=515487 /ORGANISM="Stephanopyxis turris, Strain CCMP 815" /LENGTH=447 /DNA_ID=CAMNT_0040646527 /DNA_START=141 /DNA_END=1484 /DNA_ORIENTATION=+
MKLTVKTLKGGKFTVDAEPTNTVADIKGIIETIKEELPAANMKLIHSGKVLKDDVTIEACNIKPNDFLVVMITKAKKAPAATTAAAASDASATTASCAAPAPAASTEAPSSSSAAPAPATSADSTSSAPAPAPSSDDFPAEVVGNLTGMGFPEAEVRACLRAAQGNPDVAVEFLMNGIPAMASGSVSTPAAAPATGGTGSNQLQALRDHAQFDALRRLVQTNPQSLQAVLTQIGQQQPELLREINQNQAAFLEMMNEPLSDAPASTPASAPSSGSGAVGTGAGVGSGAAAMLEGMADPAQMAQMLSNLSPTELNDMASMMGLTPQQLQATAQMIGQMPPEQFREYMMQAMQGGGMPGLGAAGGAGGGGPGQPAMLRLTEEEMASVDRLVDMGFDRTDAVQAFIACDKNEALAANLLMDSAGDGGFGFGGGSGGADESNGGDGDDMYD